MENESTLLNLPKSLLSIHNTSIYTHGSINKLGEIIDDNETDINPQNIIGTLMIYLKRLQPNEKEVFMAYFMRQSSIEELMYMYDIKSVEETIDLLNSSITSYINMIADDFGLIKK